MKIELLRQILRMTKYALIGVYIQCLLVGVLWANDINAQQQSIERIYLTVNLKDKNLEEVFSLLSEKTDFNFHYNVRVASRQRVNIAMNEASLGDVLRYLSQETGLSFKRINETIHVEKLVKAAAYVVEELSVQQSTVVTGKVIDGETSEGLPGVNVVIKGTSTGTVTDVTGAYSIEVPSSQSILVFSSIGFVSEEVEVGARAVIDIAMIPDITTLGEVVVIGYGEQRKETIVGSVSQTNTEVLQRTGGISNLGSALTGNLPGLVTNSSTGMPGEENPEIFIRGQSSWNNNAPLILVDGVERPEFFSTMDIRSVESISVLKDASATAVFGSRGANGVIIINTKRGKLGKAEITANVSSTMKVVSKLPGKYNSYDAIGVRNRAIEYELSTDPSVWTDMIPEGIRYKYANPANLEEAERYPDVDWQEALFKDYAMAYNANVGIRGGTDFLKYFASVDYQNEGDLFRDFDNERGYDPGYDYNRLNFRSNLDFQLTSTTKLQANLGGTYAVRKSPWGGGDDLAFWNSAYNGAPDLYTPKYSDGTWGYYQPDAYAGMNSIMNLSLGGVENTTTTRINTNFVLDQDLSMLLKGLSFKGTLAVDNNFVEGNRGVNDVNNGPQRKYINPVTGQVTYERAYDNTTRFDFYDPNAAWTPSGGEVTRTFRRIFYQLQLLQSGTIRENHNYTLMGLMNRQEEADANVEFNNTDIPRYREDWVFRATYNYKNKYMVEYNGAYNGSEKFAPEYRFSFFSSGGLGWMLSEENFMKSISFLDMLKLRASYGEVGDDGIDARFLFMDTWEYGQNSKMGLLGWQSEASPYTWYRQTGVGNPSVRWETAYMYNLGMEFTILNGFIDGTFDVFRNDRKDILMKDGRAIPSYFGAEAPAANLGRVQTQGYEITLGINHTFGNGIKAWANFAMTHAKDEVIERDDALLLNDYQKDAGYQLGQARTHIGGGFYNTWDELYASTQHNANNQNKIPGNYHIIDYNGDGVIDNFDSAPYGYSGVPQNTYTTTVGFEWKGFSAFVQFYGVNNVTRQVVFNSLGGQMNNVYDQGTFWSRENMDADTPMPRWKTNTAGYNLGDRHFYDGSYLRLKNAEIAYRFTSGFVNKVGLQSLRIYVNGNNLLLWTDMPDDRESNFAGTGWASQGAYPTVRRFNLGLDVTF